MKISTSNFLLGFSIPFHKVMLSGVFILAIAMVGCEKKKKYETEVSGIVKEKNGNRVIGGAKVYLIENEYYTYNTDETILDSSVTDQNGRYRFKFNEGDGYFKIAAYHEVYYSNNPNGELRGNIKLGDKQNLNIELWPHAWLKVNFLNQSGANGLNVNPFYGETFGYQIYGNNDATVVGQVKGNAPNDVNYFVYPEGKHQRETIYCAGLDTTFLQIIY